MRLDQTWRLLVAKLVTWWQALILHLPNIVVAVLVLVAFWLAARLARRVLLRALRRVSHSAQVAKLLAQTAFLGLLAAGVFVSLGILDLQKTVASLLAGAGIIGLALGFAFQDIAANFMAGIYLSVRHPFQRGHLIETKDFFGTVERVQLRWTELRTPEGQLVLIPNRQVFENPILNYSTSGRRRVDLPVGVSYDDDLDTVKKVAIEAVEGVPSRRQDLPVELFFEKFGESSIDLVVRFWIDFAKQADYLGARSEALQRIHKAFGAAGLTIPYPTRTLEFGPAEARKAAEAIGGGADAWGAQDARGTRLEAVGPSRRKP